MLERLATGDPQSPTELAAALGTPRPTIYRLLDSLCALGFVEEREDGTFQLGMRLFRLGNVVAERFADVRAAARPAMDELYEQTRQTIFLTVRRGWEAVCIERLDGELVGVMILPVGGSVPLHGGANARALLANEPYLWDDYLDAGPLRGFTDATVTSRKGLIAQLHKIRRDGYAISDEDVIPYVASIGAPLFDHAGEVRASISLSGPRPAILGENRDESITRVVAAAQSASRALGFDGDHRS